MLQEQRRDSKGEKYVIGPTGAKLTLNDLPPPGTERWVIRRKAEVVAAVRGGLLSFRTTPAIATALRPRNSWLWQKAIENHAAWPVFGRRESSNTGKPRSGPSSANSGQGRRRLSIQPCISESGLVTWLNIQRGLRCVGR